MKKKTEGEDFTTGVTVTTESGRMTRQKLHEAMVPLHTENVTFYYHLTMLMSHLAVYNLSTNA